MLGNLRLGNLNKRFGMITTQKKLIIYFFLAVIIVFFIFNSIFYKLYSANFEQIVLKESKGSVAKTSEFMDNILQSLQNTADIVQGNLSMQQKLEQEVKEEAENYLMGMDIINTLQSAANNSVGNIASIDLYLNNSKKLITTDYGIYSGFSPEIENYFMQLQLNDDKLNLISDYRKKLTFMLDRNYEQISLIRPFYNLYSGNKIGVLVINMDKYVLKNIIKRDSDSSSIIMDQNNNALISVFSDAHKELPQKLDSLMATMDQDSGEIFFSLNGQKHILVFSTSEYTGWKFVTVIRTTTSMKEMNLLRDYILILFLLMNIITALVLLILLTEKIFRKVNKLIASMKEVEKGNFDITIQHGDKDEFGFMYTSFNNMTEKIKSLFGELYQQKLLQKDAELKLLQSKINPHFIYNIFDNMNWLIQLERYEELESLVDAVSTYYKKSLNVGRDFITIADTIEQLKSYVEIQKIRFKDRFTCTFDFEDELLETQILNFILQPLVENAICHGIEPKTEKCHILVKGLICGENICLSVEDNGMGIKEEKLKEINYYFENEQAQTDDYFAITNINKRIRIFYGSDYGLKITSTPSEGTLVLVTIPSVQPVKVEEYA